MDSTEETLIATDQWCSKINQTAFPGVQLILLLNVLHNSLQLNPVYPKQEYSDPHLN